MKSKLWKFIRTSATACLIVAALGASEMAVSAQTQPAVRPDAANQLNELKESVHELQEQVQALSRTLAVVQDEAARSRAETANLRQDLLATRPRTSARYDSAVTGSDIHDSDTAIADKSASPYVAPLVTSTSSSSSSSSSSRVSRLEEEFDLLTGKVDELHQTKLESAAKYRVRFSGIVLLNLASNQGLADSIDVPTYALQPSSGLAPNSFGATVRQSQLGFEVFGPKLLGAKTSADLQLDFGGGFVSAPNGVNAGIVRLRTGTVRLDWDSTSVVAGQDGLFFTPQNPTSFASLTVPALAYSGNLWSWTPQVRVEHRWLASATSSFILQAGILDNLTGEIPYSSYYRFAQAGEASRQPAYAARAAWVGKIFGQPLTLGSAGYLSRQDYEYGHQVTGWAAMSDWSIPLGQRLQLSGEIYRGFAAGGIGAGLGRSVLFSGDPLASTTLVRGLNSAGGWSQLKIHASSRLEFNAAFGQDSSFAHDLKAFPAAQAYVDPTISANRSFLGNFVFRPRSDLLFSAEYRRIKTSYFTSGPQTAGQFNLVMGVLF